MLLKNNINRVFKIFYENPDREFHLRELARISRISTTAVRDALTALTKKKIIVKREIGVYDMFKADIDSKNYKEIKKAFEILKKL